MNKPIHNIESNNHEWLTIQMAGTSLTTYLCKWCDKRLVDGWDSSAQFRAVWTGLCPRRGSAPIEQEPVTPDLPWEFDED